MSAEYRTKIFLDLVLFDLVYVSGGIRNASKVSGVPISKLSRSISNLESVCNRKLFINERNSFLPTDFAHAIYQKCDIAHKTLDILSNFERIVKSRSYCISYLNNIKFNIFDYILNSVEMNTDMSSLSLSFNTYNYCCDRSMNSDLRNGNLDILFTIRDSKESIVESKYIRDINFHLFKINNHVFSQNNENFSHLVIVGSGSLDVDNDTLENVYTTYGEHLRSKPVISISDILDIEGLSYLTNAAFLLNDISSKSLISKNNMNLQPIDTSKKITVPIFANYHRASPNIKITEWLLKKIIHSSHKKFDNPNFMLRKISNKSFAKL